MRLSEDEARRRFAAARVVRLATADEEGRPHLVPVTFVVRGDTVVFAVDHKPKRHRQLKRLANMLANSAVCLLADEYDEDWTQLWWARADGSAHVGDFPEGDAERAAAVEDLMAKYPQYGAHPPDGPLVGIAVGRWSGWSAAE